MPNLAILKALGITLEEWKNLSDADKKKATEAGNKRIADSHAPISITYGEPAFKMPEESEE